ncbi:unnamed protein product [Prunus armeniaca]|uniref:Uncharacterized protein n=1 Tax=Prunus armeniaca TaxID=36596 RepID=A0A6J5U7T2_PRUAR|nr:unnamed protein product [Prunus armeniaca]
MNSQRRVGKQAHKKALPNVGIKPIILGQIVISFQCLYNRELPSHRVLNTETHNIIPHSSSSHRSLPLSPPSCSLSLSLSLSLSYLRVARSSLLLYNLCPFPSSPPSKSRHHTLNCSHHVAKSGHHTATLPKQWITINFWRQRWDYVKRRRLMAKDDEGQTRHPLVVAVLPDVLKEHRRSIWSRRVLHSREIEPVCPPGTSQFAMGTIT